MIVMKIKASTGFVLFETLEEALRFSKARLEAGLKITVYFDGELYRVEFEPI